MKTKTTWALKMDKPVAPDLQEGPASWNASYGGKIMVIPTPRLIEKLLYEIPKGKIKTLSSLRQEIANETGADYACPLTTGIFLRICSEYAEELRSEGVKKIPPYWRVVRDDGSPIEKFPGGPEAQIRILKSEGRTFKRKSSRSERLVVEM